MKISIDQKDNFRIWYNFDMLRFRSKIVTNLVSSGASETDKEFVLENWNKYEENCKRFIEGLIDAYNAHSDEKLPKEHSLSFDIDFINNSYTLEVIELPFNPREFALNNINLVLVRKVLEDLLQ